MATLNAKKLGRVLHKAKEVGRAELDFTLDGMSLVLQSLRPQEYVDINDDTKELEDIAYLTEWRRAHLCRSLVEVDDQDLRGIDYIEDDVESTDPKGTVTVKTVKFPRYIWLRDNLLSEWGKEAIDVAFRKFTEVVELAEKKAARGVDFAAVDETAEDKFRRQLGEALETAADVPGDLVAKTFEALGLTANQVTKKDMEAANERLAKFAEETPDEPRRYHSPIQVERPEEDLEEAVPLIPPQGRQPLNRVAPVIQQETVVKTRSVPPVPVPVQTSQPLKGRAAEYASLEAEAGMDAGMDIVGGTQPATPEQLRRLQASQQQPKLATPTAVVLDAPQRGGINPRFQRPQR